MSVPLKPQQNFTVVRQIANHLDASTYYVQAVIRNAYTDELITTLQLTDKGGQRFSKNWQVPADPSGMGFYISIVTSVYTDSGYTTKSENYGDEESTHLVSDVFALPARSGAGGLDSYTVRRIFKEELAKAQPEPPEAPEMRFDEVLSALAALRSAVEDAEAPEADDDESEARILGAIASLQQAIQDKPVTPATDTTPLVDQMTAMAQVIQSAVRELSMLEGSISNLVEALNHMQANFSKDVVGELDRIVKETEFAIAPSTAKLSLGKPKPDADEEPSIDLDAITS